MWAAAEKPRNSATAVARGRLPRRPDPPRRLRARRKRLQGGVIPSSIMDLSQALERLRYSGYCLWVGAGVSIHLGRAASQTLPGWKGLVEHAERPLDLMRGEYPGKPDFSLPERLDIVARNLGRASFDELVFRHLLKPLDEALWTAAREGAGKDVPFPKEVSQLASVGMRANPIVNFNIEHWTSVFLAAPGGPFAVRPFDVLADAQAPSASIVREYYGKISEPDGRRYIRSVYHPHGVLRIADESGRPVGRCVLTQQDYDQMSGTLALELAVHAAFGSNLAIVGLSLDDKYLLDQLARFRKFIRTIYWFHDVDALNDDKDRWCYRHGVDRVTVRWPEFWDAVAAKMPQPGNTIIARLWREVVTELAQGRQVDDKKDILRSVDRYLRAQRPRSAEDTD